LNTYWSSTAYHRIRFLSLSFRERLEMVLADLGYRFGVVESRGTILTLELSHDSLAEMIGSSRPMVSRLIGEMTAEGGSAGRENITF
jgi:CRP-like cAMP-binding protein